MAEFNKNGVAKGKLLLEYLQEPDGSIWEPILYHKNPAGQLFSSSDDFEHGVVKDSTMFFNFNVCKELTSWEFLFIQRIEAESEYKKYRWRQSKSPFTASYSDVSPSAVTRVTTTGYTDGGFGGFYNLGSYSKFIVANNSNGNSYGRAGAWTAYQGGIPGYPNTVVTSGDIAAFVRIDGTNLSLKTKIYPNTGIIVTRNFIQR